MKKKIFTLMMLLTAICSGAWAGIPVDLYERTAETWVDADLTAWAGTGTAEISGGLKTSGGNEGYERSLTVATQENSLVKYSATWDTGSSTGRAGGYNYLRLGGVEFRAYGQDAKGTYVIDGVETTFTSAKTDVRDNAVWAITVTIDKAAKKHTIILSYPGNQDGIQVDGSIANTSDALAIGFHKPGRVSATHQTLQAVAVSEMAQEVETASYTVKWVDTDSKEIKASEVRSGVVDTNPVLSATDTESFYTTDEAGTVTGKYNYKSDNAADVTISQDGTTEVVIIFAAAEKVEYKVTAVGNGGDETTLSSGTCWEQDKIKVYYPRYVLFGTDLDCIGSGSISYSDTFEPTATNKELKLYYQEGVKDVVYYTEGEAVEGVSAGSNDARASMGKMGYTGSADNYAEVTTVAPGKYVLYMRAQNGNSSSRAFSFMLGEETVYAGSFATGTNLDFNSEEFTVLAESTLSFASEGSSASGIDYLYLVKTGEAEVPASETIEVGATGYATYVSDYDLNFSATNIKAYTVKVTAKAVATMTQVNQVPAKTPVLLYVQGGASEAVPTMSGAAAVADNDLVAGPGTSVMTTDGDFTNMILNNGSNGIGFYLAAGKDVPKNRAYLHFDSSLKPGADAPMVLVFDGFTAIERVESAEQTQNAQYFDLQGRRVAQPGKGLYIVNGKKLVVK